MRRELTMNLANQVALVTGGGQGIGYACAQALADAGASVVVADISSEHAAKAVDAIQSKQRRALAVQADVGDLAGGGVVGEIARMVRATLKTLGQINIEVKKPGVPRGADIMDLTEAD